MALKNFLITATLILTCLTLWSCQKDELNCTGDRLFCLYVYNNDLNATGTLINAYLAGLKKNNSDENLQKLADWLECKTCVEKAEVLCNSCIYTLPAQSELRVKFVPGGQNKTLDILMSNPLKYWGYH